MFNTVFRSLTEFGVIPKPDRYDCHIAPLVLAGAISAGSKLMSSIGGKRAANQQREDEQSRIDRANEISGEDYAAQVEHNDLIKGMFGPGGQYSSMLTDPLTSTTTGSTSSSSSTTPTFTAEGSAAIADMLKSAMSERGRAESLPEFAGLEEGMARDYGGQMSGLKTALGNRAARRGGGPIDTDLEAILAGRGITSDYLGRKQALPGMKEQARLGKNQIANMLMGQVAGLGRGTKTKSRGSSTSTSQRDQGAGAMMNFLNMTRPPEKKVYV